MTRPLYCSECDGLGHNVALCPELYPVLHALPAELYPVLHALPAELTGWRRCVEARRLREQCLRCGRTAPESGRMTCRGCLDMKKLATRVP